MESAPLLQHKQKQCLQVPQNSRGSSETSEPDLGTCQSPRRRGERRRGRLNAELLNAVLEGNIAEVTRTLEAGASVNATCRPSRTTALQLAVACDQVEIASWLMGKGADVTRRDREGRQAIHIAAAKGDTLLLKLLLDSASSSINSQVTPSNEPDDHECLDNWSHNHGSVANKIPKIPPGTTPLHLSTQRLHLGCVTMLLEQGARVDLQDERGLTPLDVVGEIPSESSPHSPGLSSNALIDLADSLPTSDEPYTTYNDDTLVRINNMKQRIGRIPHKKPLARKIRTSTSLDDPNASKPSMLRIASTDSNTSTEEGENSPIPVSLRTMPFDPVAFSSQPKSPSIAQKVVNSLINKGAKMPKSKVIVKQGGVQNQVTMQMTCLHTAVERGDLQLIEYLLDNGACQLTWNNEGLTPLHLAVTLRHLEPLRILLEKNKSTQVVDARDFQGRTPLHLAVAQEWCPGVSLLLEAGTDVKVTSNDNQTVLHLAAAKSESALLEELLTIPESVKILDSRNNLHETPLCCAVCAGQLACVELLLNKGADITTSLPGDITLLHLAAERGNRNVLERLLRDSRISPFKNVRTKEGKGGATALHFAALGGFVSCVKILITTGCNVYEVTTRFPHRGSTALHLAGMKGHTKVVECLIKHNKNTLNVKNADGWYPLHVAARFAKKECVRFMLLNGANLGATVFDSGGNKKTAFDIIVYSIIHPVSFLENIFNCCIEVNGYPLNNPKCEVKVKYDILQPLGPKRKQLKVLDSLLNCGKKVVQEKLLLHPLVETFLFLKWKKLKVFFFIMMALYMIFTVSLTTMALSFYVIQSQSAIVNACVHSCRLTLCISLTLITLQELLQAARMKKYYISDLESWVKWSSFLLATVVVLGHHPGEWLVHISAVAVLLSWLELLFLLSRWPASLGFYILMFFTVAKNVLRVLASFTFVILGFMFAFMIHFRASGPFPDWWEAFSKVMVMTIEFEYESMFENIKGLNATSIVGRGIFLAFMVLVAIVLMNLLVGLAVSDIATLEKQGRAQRLAKQIDFLSMLEVFVYSRTLFSCCPNKVIESVKRCRAVDTDLRIEPGKPLHKYRNPLPVSMTQAVINSIVNRGKNDDDECSCDDSDDTNNQEESKSPTTNPKETDKPKDSDVESQIKSSLDLIMKELAAIKQEIEIIKTFNKSKSSTSQPANQGFLIQTPNFEDQSSRLLRT